jgi:hypothetical protein
LLKTDRIIINRKSNLIIRNSKIIWKNQNRENSRKKKIKFRLGNFSFDFILKFGHETNGRIKYLIIIKKWWWIIVIFWFNIFMWWRKYMLHSQNKIMFKFELWNNKKRPSKKIRTFKHSWKNNK